MNMKLVFCLLAMCSFVCNANMYDDWAKQNAVNLNESAAQNVAENPSAPILQRIKQESQSCNTVVVRLMQRPLDKDIMKDSVGGVARKATGGTAAHVQVVAMDKSTGRVIDNFGVTGDFAGGGKASIFSESSLDKYDSEPCGIYEMSSEDYYAARARTIEQIEGGAIYEPYSGVGLVGYAKIGAEAGAQVAAPLGSIALTAGAVAGAVGGAMAANDIYETRRHDYGIHSDSNVRMSFPIVNCQAGGDLFVKNLEGLPTVVTVKKYIHPGENATQPGVCLDEAECVIDTSRLESLLKEGISFLTDIIAKGKRITNSQVDSHNQRLKEIMAELVNIAKQIEALDVSEDEKKIIGEKALAKVKELMSQFSDLNERAKSLGLVYEATSEQKRVLVNDALGKQTEAPCEVEQAKASSAKATDASQLHTITAEEAISLLRDD